jgi:hypothetical protein
MTDIIAAICDVICNSSYCTNASPKAHATRAPAGSLVVICGGGGAAAEKGICSILLPHSFHKNNKIETEKLFSVLCDDDSSDDDETVPAPCSLFRRFWPVAAAEQQSNLLKTSTKQ